MKHGLLVAGVLALGGCAAVSTVPHNEVVYGNTASAGLAYSLPKGVVPVEVFVEDAGIGLTIEPAQLVADSTAGQLVARLRPSIFNDENMKLAADPATGFLQTVSSESTAQIVAIAQEAAKTVGRLKLTNAKAQYFAKRVVVFSDSFDPYDPADVARINDGIAMGFERASRAFDAAKGRADSRLVSDVRLDVASLPPPAPAPWGPYKKCESGVCVRAMTTHRVRVLLDGRPFASKIVALPSREVIAVPAPQTILANQKLHINITNGILASYEVERDSELLGAVKIPGAIIGGLVTGITEGLTSKKTVTEKTKELVDAQAALEAANKKATQASLDLNAAVAKEDKPPATAAYTSTVLTVYPYSQTLTDAIKLRVLKPGPTEPGPESDRGAGTGETDAHK